MFLIDVSYVQQGCGEYRIDPCKGFVTEKISVEIELIEGSLSEEVDMAFEGGVNTLRICV